MAFRIPRTAKRGAVSFLRSFRQKSHSVCCTESRSIHAVGFPTSTVRYVKCHTPPLLTANARILPLPRGPDIGMARLAVPPLPLKCTSPEMSQSGLTGSPMRWRTCELAAAWATACLYTSLCRKYDVTPVITIRETTPRSRNSVRQPTGIFQSAWRSSQLLFSGSGCRG